LQGGQKRWEDIDDLELPSRTKLGDEAKGKRDAEAGKAKGGYKEYAPWMKRFFL
jgi:hypothetical protein